jgi:hypothetical protein
MKRRDALAATALGILLPGCGGGGEGFASIGSGGTGISPGGIGSGGTGVVVTSTTVGPVEGFGSIVVNGIRFDTATAQLDLRDVDQLRLGIVVQVLGSFDPATNLGAAAVVRSSAELRGMVSGLDLAAGRFLVKGVVVEVDDSTVFAGGLADLADVRDTQPVQVHGLPGDVGQLRATRVELLAVVGSPVVSGVVEDLDSTGRTFRVGSQVVHYATATLDAALPASGLANGRLVRVRAAATSPVLEATSIEPWSQAAVADAEPLSLGGLVSDFRSLASLRVDGLPVDASRAKVSGGPVSSVRNGTRVDVTGVVQGGVLVASRIRLRGDAPATAADMPFSAQGSIGSFRSVAQFKVQGQDIDASRATIVTAGSLASLRSGLKVLVTGSRVVDDVLIADRVEILQGS